MTRTTYLCAAALVLVPATGARATDGGPDVAYAANHGDTGFISLIYDVPSVNSPEETRTLQADCSFAILPSVGTSTVEVVVTGQASAASGPTSGVTAAATGVRCEVRTGAGTQAVEAARPGAVASVSTVLVMRLAAITLCASPSALWDDGTYQAIDAPLCVTG